MNHVFLDIMLLHLNRWQYNIDITYVHWENKKFVWLTFLWYLLYCSFLEPNLQYLLGLPECNITFFFLQYHFYNQVPYEKEGIFTHLTHKPHLSITAIYSPDCPGGGIPPRPRGSLTNTERTAALLPKHGSRAMGLGTVWWKKTKNYLKRCSLRNSFTAFTCDF